MGDCAKFGPIEEDLTPEQRIEKLEGRIPNLIERIQSYDAALADIASVKRDMLDIKEYISHNTDVLVDLNSKLDKIGKRVDSEAGLMRFHVDSINENIRKIEDICDRSYGSQRSNINALSSHLDSVEKKVDYHFRSKASCEDLSFLKKELASHREDFAKDLDSHARWIDQIADESESHKDAYTSLTARIEAQSKDIEMLKQVAVNLPSALKESEQRNAQAFFAKAAELSSHSEGAIAKATASVKPAVELQSKLASLEASLSEFTVDVQNANIRSSNASKQVAAIEKKIENILLQLKRQDLEK